MEKYYDDGWNDYVDGKAFDNSQRTNKNYRDGYYDAKEYKAEEKI